MWINRLKDVWLLLRGSIGHNCGMPPRFYLCSKLCYINDYIIYLTMWCKKYSTGIFSWCMGLGWRVNYCDEMTIYCFCNVIVDKVKTLLQLTTEDLATRYLAMKKGQLLTLQLLSPCNDTTSKKANCNDPEAG